MTNIVTKLMAPEFPVVSSKLTPTGLCQGALTEISISSGAGAGSGAGGSDTVNSDVTAVSHGEHYIIGLVIPALVIAVMLLCAGLVACVLYRRKRTGKMSVGDEDERQTFKSKGIPVIFQVLWPSGTLWVGLPFGINLVTKHMQIPLTKFMWACI